MFVIHTVPWLLLLLIVGFAGSLAQQQVIDVVYLKNGSIIRGRIVSGTPDSVVVIRTADGGNFILRREQVANMEREAVARSGRPIRGSEKSPWLAGAMSFVVPGTGQFYNSDWVMGAIHLSLAAGGVAVALTMGTETVSEYVRTGTRTVRDSYGNISYYQPIYGYEYYDEVTPWLYVGLGVAAATLVWSVLDAVLTAGSRNEQIRSRRSLGALEGCSFALVPYERGFRAQLRLAF